MYNGQFMKGFIHVMAFVLPDLDGGSLWPHHDPDFFLRILLPGI